MDNEDIRNKPFVRIAYEIPIAEAMRRFPYIDESGPSAVAVSGALDFTEALKIVAEVHGNQLDKSGCPYVEHCARVAMAMKTDEERVTGWLHDAVEDTPGSLMESYIASPKDRILERIRTSYGDAIATSIFALTRMEHGGHPEPYMDFIRRLSVDPLARAVKIADIRDNLRGERLRSLPPEVSGRLVNKYAPALQFLEGLL